MAIEEDIVDKSGARYSYKEDRIGQRRKNAKIYMANHPEMMVEVSALVRAAYGTSEEVTVPEGEKGQEESPLVGE